MKFGQKLRFLRKQKKLTLQQIADTWGISRSSVSGWESGDSRPDQDKLPALARLLGVTVDDLLSDRKEFSAPPSANQNIEPAPYNGRLPLISWVQAGMWCETIDNFQPGDAEEWIPCPFRHGPHAYILKVVGKSMYDPGGEKSFNDGEFIAVDPDKEAINKSLVVVRKNDENTATFKQLIIESNGDKYLVALNPSWPNRIIPVDGDATICGVVIGKWVPE